MAAWVQAMHKTELARKVYQAAYITGDFLLRSGKRSNEYFDKYRFESRPELLREIAQQLAPFLPRGIDYLAGLEMGGIPIATALSLETGIPCVFVRKEAKAYGTCQFAEGAPIAGKRLCVVEDVITSGGQVLISTEDLRKAGAQVDTALCVINRSGSDNPLASAQLTLHSLFTMEELKSSGAP
jgi:orotate phosphoribosyltransferase